MSTTITITVGEETFTQNLTPSELVHLVVAPVWSTIDVVSWKMQETPEGQRRLDVLKEWVQGVNDAAARVSRGES